MSQISITLDLDDSRCDLGLGLYSGLDFGAAGMGREVDFPGGHEFEGSSRLSVNDQTGSFQIDRLKS